MVGDTGSRLGDIGYATSRSASEVVTEDVVEEKPREMEAEGKVKGKGRFGGSGGSDVSGGSSTRDSPPEADYRVVWWQWRFQHVETQGSSTTENFKPLVSLQPAAKESDSTKIYEEGCWD